MADQQDASKPIMYAAVAFSALLFVFIVFSLLSSGVETKFSPDESALARIRPVAVFGKEPVAPTPALTEQERIPDLSPPLGAAPAETVAASTASHTSSAPRSASDIYASVCHTCHDTGLIGAPKKGDRQAWAPRIATGKDSLYTSALKGKGAMPVRGGSPGLSDDEVKSVVDYMVSLAQ